MRIKYFDGAEKLERISKGNWIDCYANKDIFVEKNTRAMIPLGFALELPNGWEGHLAPRSSTFKSWGVIQTNSVGVVDDSYIGDNDQWHMPVFCIDPKDKIEEDVEGSGYKKATYGTWIKKGDKISICGKNCSNWGVAFLSVFTYGAVAVPILNDFKEDNIHHIVNDSDSRMLFVGASNLSKLTAEEMPNLECLRRFSRSTCVAPHDDVYCDYPQESGFIYPQVLLDKNF